MTNTTFLAAATSYAAMGWPVLPLAPLGKEPLTKRGLLQATDDPNQIEWLWAKYPDANIGIRTGVAFDAIDLDGPEAIANLAALAPGYKHNGPVSSTGRGFHLIVQTTGNPNFAHPLTAGGPHAGIDFRGRNGYIVAPPSIHPSGATYRWVRPISLALPVRPEWLVPLFPTPLVRKTQYNSAASASAAGSLDLVSELTRLGADLRPYGGNKLKGLCPFHSETQPSFVVYLATDSFFCHGCRAWGDALNVRRFADTGALR